MTAPYNGFTVSKKKIARQRHSVGEYKPSPHINLCRGSPAHVGIDRSSLDEERYGSLFLIGLRFGSPAHVGIDRRVWAWRAR